MKVNVSTTRNKDIGRGIGRIDPKTMEDLGAGVRTYTVTGKNMPMGRMLPPYPYDNAATLQWGNSVWVLVTKMFKPIAPQCLLGDLREES
ncbi:MAG: hypothetical protein Q7T80_12615 [Methanoregula sp.]|nr:hypothetical protein [Methanoregula sp.]